MELYFKDSEGKLQEVKLISILKTAFTCAGFKMENGSFEGENHHWIGIVQESKKPSQVVTNITFKDDGNTITGLKVYESPIKRIVDEDNSKQVI
jgi:hypothetical protein